MNLLKTLWHDDAGYVISAEAVLVGTLGILGATVGLKAAGTAINDEFTEIGQAIRSLNQSYVIPEQGCGCGAWTAGSCYMQPSIDGSIHDLCAGVEADPRTLPPATPVPPDPTLPPLPEPPAADRPANEIPPEVR